MSKHTPRPWYPGRALGNGQECIVGDGDTVVCYMPDKTIGCTLKPEDAWLIAAAPDMYRALQHLAKCLHPWIEAGHSVPGIATLNGAFAALAKADGRSA